MQPPIEPKRIIIEDGKPPEFSGAWTVGEVLQMAQQLAHWVESLRVNQSVIPEQTPQQ